MVNIDAAAKTIVEALRTDLDEEIEKKKLKDKDEKKEIQGFKWVRCFHCGRHFREINWHEPPSCPFCRRSRVD